MASIPCLFRILVLSPLVMSATTSAQTTYANITRGTTITALSSTTSLLSSSGDFAAGFFPLNSSNNPSSTQQFFLFGVWFDVTTPKTLIWAANRDAPVQAGSIFQFTSDGKLSLRDHTNKEIWNPGGFFIDASLLALLIDGNLVLATSSSSLGAKVFLWQSFGDPTDTLLPGQVLAAPSSLRSQLTATDISHGRFELDAQNDGNFVLYPLDLDTGDKYDAYWSSDTVASGKQLVYNQSGSIYFTLNNGTRLSIITTATYSPSEFYQRATLDYDGVFRQYVYPKAAGTPRNGKRLENKWNPVAIVPSNICQDLQNKVGSGACGFNSYCEVTLASDNQLGLVNCDCPPKYKFIDPQKKYKGCEPDFVPQSCDKDDSADFDLTLIPNLDWPLSDYAHVSTVDQSQCQQLCLDDCFCAVVIYNSVTQECWKKKMPLSNGKMGSTVERIAFVKFSRVQGNASTGTVVETVTKKGGRTLLLIGSLLLSCCVLITLITIAWLPWHINKKRSRNNAEEQGIMASLNLRVFTYRELEKATKGFSEEVGSGASGVVYKGYLGPSSLSTASYVAVKKLDRLFQESDKEFKNELRSIGQAHHKNLVKLIGLCEEGTHRLLVYEYMRNGSLMSFLFEGSKKPSWNQRVHVALGIARGLTYLHDECLSQIIHCDIKPQNVLLDDNFAPRISDFGLAKLLRTDQTRTNTGITGTRGYVAPEWFKSMPITNKVDVYSFGVMLLELVCCRRNLEADSVGQQGKEPVLIYWAYDNYRGKNLRHLLPEDDQEAMADMERVKAFVKVAIWCIQEDPSLRPSMHKVSLMLEGSTTVASPPDPNPLSTTYVL